MATIDPSTLTAQTHKKTCRRKDGQDRIFIYEPRMGDAEEIEIDEAGRIVRIVDNTGNRIALKSFRGRLADLADKPEGEGPVRSRLSKRFIAIRTSIAKLTLAIRYRNAVIPSTAIRAPKDCATRESATREFHKRNSNAPDQTNTPGHTIRMVRVTTVAKPSRRRRPSTIGRNEFGTLMTRWILKRFPATLPSKNPRFAEVGHPNFLGGSTFSCRIRAACSMLIGVENSNLRNGGRRKSVSVGSKSAPAIGTASNIGGITT